METSELLKKVRRIEIKTRGLSRNIFAGQYHSAFKGRGMAFSEVREYQYGDDIRDIDWNVTARYVRPYVKVFEEERELTVMLLIDVSGSRDFGSVNVMKKEVITEIAATLAFSAIQNKDKIGVVFFSDKIEKFIPPQKGKKHILYIIRELIDFHPEETRTDISQVLKYLTNAIKKRCTAFLISDFIDKEGFKDALTEALGDAVSFNEQNASGESVNCATIVNGLVASQVDLILANATAPLQAAASATADIPVLGTAVTDYASALEIDNWTGTVGGNISGTSDLAPLDQQAAVLQELFPDAKTVGLLYCSAESNSKYQVDMIRGYLEQAGLTCEEYAFTDTNDVASVTQKACDSSDVIYIPTDNTAASNTEAIANVVLPAGVPVIAGEEGICQGCGVATLSISYYDLGYATGKMAVKILTGEADISTMPVEYAPQVTKKYNAANCETLGVTVPDDYAAIEG